MKKIHFFGGAALVVLLALAVSSSMIFETNMAGNIQVKQAAITGTLTCQTEPGTYFQNFGTITTFKEAEHFAFTANEKNNLGALPTRFNDATKAQVSGSLRVLLPSDCDSLQLIHRKFHSMDGVMNRLVLPAVRKALFSTGPHMSAGESYAVRRNEFAELAEDQLQFGVIMTDTRSVKKTDTITGEVREIQVVTRKTCEPGTDRCIHGYTRDASAFGEFGINITNFVIEGIAYPKNVTAQIETQREARMNIITVQAQAKEAVARALKAEAEAKASVAETRAKEEIAKTQMVVKAEAAKAVAILVAERKKEAAALDAETAALEKKAKILRAEGDAEAARKLIKADGALDKKLAIYKAVNERWAQAYEKQRPTPDVVFGGANGMSRNPAGDFMNILMLKAAKDLRVDLEVKQ